jgi:uncharacterized protein (TIGR02266 family)
VTRLALRLDDRHDWVKVFDPTGVATNSAPSPPPAGADVHVDLTLEEGGPRVILKGSVLWAREPGESDGDPSGCAVGLSVSEREKVNFLNGYVRGGLLNRRERRRLPLRLPIAYGGLDGTCESVTRDINEDGLFIVSTAPLPEETILHFVLALPGGAPPLELKATVSHTVIVEDEDVPGMGVRYLVDDPAEKAAIKKIVDGLEEAFMTGLLPDDVIS